MSIITQNKIIIRKAKLSDLPAIFKMWKKLIDHHKKKVPKQLKLKKNANSIWEKYIKKQTYNKNAQIFIAEFKNKSVAYALFGISKFPPQVYIIDEELKVLDVFVEERFRGKGIAQKLIKEGLKWGKKKGYSGHKK